MINKQSLSDMFIYRVLAAVVLAHLSACTAEAPRTHPTLATGGLDAAQFAHGGATDAEW